MTGIDELIGKTLGGYVIEERIGKGGMSTVYRATQTSMKRTVALKILPRELMADDAYLARFEREVSIVAQLEHRNIVPVYDHGESEGQPFIAMRYMMAGSVDRHINEKGMDLRKIVSVFNQIAPALDYAHTKNVLHRDLKPSNVLMDDNDGYYLTDFGIARILGVEGQGSTITTQGVVGTPSYMSPEQAQGLPMDGRSDVYALGVMLFEMATGRRPFISDTPYSIAVMQVTTEPPSARKINPNIPPAVEQVIYKALRKKPDERYQTGIGLAEALEMAVENPGSTLLDTQPRPIDVRSLQSGHGTQPSQPIQHQASPKPVPQMPSNTPSAVPSSAPVLPVPPSQISGQQVGSRGRAQSRRKIRRSSNMWLSMAIGALIGCGLLAVAIVMLILALQALFGESTNPTPEPVREELSQAALLTTLTGETVPASTNIPTREALSITATSADEGAQVFETSTPEGEVVVQNRTTNSNSASITSAHVLYFAERTIVVDVVDDEELTRKTFDVFQHNLANDIARQLTNDDSNQLYATVSPDGMRVVFQSDVDGDYDLYLIEASNEIEATSTEVMLEATRIFNSDVDAVFPAWSPDGEWIVFSADTRSDGSYDLFVVRPDGTGLRRLYTNGRRNSHPRWSPDGSQIAFITGEPNDANTWDISVIELDENAEALDVRRVINDDTRQAWVTFNVEGTMLYFVNGTGIDTAIARLPSDTVGANQDDIEIIHDKDDFIWGLTATPDGRNLVFSASGVSDQTSEVYAISLDGGVRRSLGLENATVVAWMP